MSVNYKNFEKELVLPNSELLYNEEFNEYVNQLISKEDNLLDHTYFIVIDNWYDFFYYKIKDNKIANTSTMRLLSPISDDVKGFDEELKQNPPVVEIKIFDKSGQRYDI